MSGCYEKTVVAVARGEKELLEIEQKTKEIYKKNKKSKDRVHQLAESDLSKINQKIEDASRCFPIEFQRKGRPLEEIEHWKAVEFRTFLLYSGPVVLKGILPIHKYEHFLLFHVAIRILCSPSLTSQQTEYANSCLKCFVEQFGHIYGAHHLIYSVHSLLHLANECKVQQGPLDSFSAFPFESYLGQLKKLLRGTRRPLSQLKKRLSEMECHDPYNTIRQVKSGLQSIKVNSLRDSFFMVKSRQQVVDIKSKSNTTVTGVQYFLKAYHERWCKINLFEIPLDSSMLQIFVVEKHMIDDEDNLITLAMPPENDFVKCVRLKFERKFVFFPIIHHL